MKVASSVADLIGDTPLLALDRYAEGAPAQLLAKLEMFNPISIKDRPVWKMIQGAEERGQISAGDTLVEATSGNTGMALAYIGSIKGYRVILCMSEIQSVERRNVLKALGAELILTPASQGTTGAKQKALEIHESTPGSFYVGQHHNPDNRRAHRETTGPEIWADTDGRIDLLVAPMGTCGTICGVSEFIKPRKPDFRAIGVEPKEAPMLSKGEWEPHRLMGTSPGFIPDILDRHLIDEMVTVSEDEAFEACRQIAEKEGLLVGISSGAAAYAASRLSRRPENRGKLILCIFADTGERYLSVEGLFE